MTYRKKERERESMRRSVCERERASEDGIQTDNDEMKIVVTARERGTVMR